MIEELKQLFKRDLETLRKEILAYKEEALLWKKDQGISNSAGNLCLHICGNLQHFFGHLMGGGDYQRKREEEFSLSDVSRFDLLHLIDESEKAVNLGLGSLDKNKLGEQFPVQVLGQPMTYAFFAIHLSGHLNYHLGQINYHRRLLTSL